MLEEIKQEEFEKELKENENLVLDFYSTECPPCEALAPKFESLTELYGKDVRFIKMFRQGNRELAEKLGVKSSPTLLFYKNGKQTGDFLTGGIRKSDIIRNLDNLLPPEKVQSIKDKIKRVVTHTDVIVLGAGPGGMAAGIYLAQAKIDTILLDTGMPGGQVTTTHQVSNYPGFIEPQKGYMLSHYMAEQAKVAGVKFKVAVDVNTVDLIKKEVVIDGYETIKAKKIIISTGASPRYLNIDGEKEFYGKGISYCATCDAKYYHDKEVVIIGGGNTAVEESEFISKFASKITMIQQLPHLTANKTAQERCYADPKIEVMLEYEPRGFYKNGSDKMKVKLEDLKTRQTKTLETDGIFVFVGMKPNTDMIKDPLETDDWGYIKVDDEMRTSIHGVYAVGDVISKKYRQITTAVGDGTIASIACTKEIND
ncbi:MAG: thioredoxin-disulfide reductase [Bacteroidetes bacterium]|nr:MAG: thioredoxin-disulfide reductase [Bacteroidota bacterium]